MRMGITELAVKLRKREISAVELTKAYIDAIEKLNPTLNAYVHLTFDTALEAAEQADQMLKEDDAPLLCGIPMALKDNICTDGIPTTCCSKILEGFKPYYDATVWERLKKQGAVLLGKTNMDEFGMGSTSETSCYGAPLNPRNTNYVTGGSSGGSAAAICANLAVYSLARIPAVQYASRLPSAAWWGLSPPMARYPAMAYCLRQLPGPDWPPDKQREGRCHCFRCH